jgi:hypothetical protein
MQARELRRELLDLHFEVLAFANEAIEMRRHACDSFLQVCAFQAAGYG